MDEVWKDIEGYDGKYKVSNMGNVLTNNYKNKKITKILKPSDNGRGYLGVSLYKNGKIHSKTIHKIVAEAFIDNPYNLPQVNHKDGDKNNNTVDNLEWCTAKENIRHAWKNGLVKITEERRQRSIKQLEKYTKTIAVEINQYTLDEKYIKTWKSIKEASETLKIPAGNICNCCKRKLKQAGGYIWAYEWK